MSHQRRAHPSGQIRRKIVPGVAWYRREQWPRLRDVSADADALEETYDEWEAMALDALQQLRARGIEPARIDIDVEELLRWCQAGGRPVDAKARSAFAAIKTRQHHEMH